MTDTRVREHGRIARHGSGVMATVSALASQVHPVFMLPPLAIALFGALLADSVHLGLAGIHVLAIFAAVYTAHVKDGYVDFYRRNEDDDHPLTPLGCRLGLYGAAVVFWVATAAVYVIAGPIGAALTAPGWFIGTLHAPQLDSTTIGATAGYPLGIALCLLGGFAVQAGTVGVTPIALATTLFVLLSGVKIIDDSTDVEYDTAIGKPTVAVVFGQESARTAATLLMGLGCMSIIWFVADGLLPPGALFAVVVFGPIGYLAYHKDAETATKLLIRGTYLFVAALVAAVWYEPLAGVPLPDIAVFGPYTYLLTELFFGAIALGLLIHANALWTAARTIAVLYPLGYVWDWYTLTVGVFAIELRTGIELFAIPIEEHLFMIVVPAMVLGVHETIRQWEARTDTHPTMESG